MNSFSSQGLNAAILLDLQQVRCPCGTMLPATYVVHVIRHPFAHHPCLNPDCEMHHRYIPPQTIRSERLPSAEPDTLCYEAPAPVSAASS